MKRNVVTCSVVALFALWMFHVNGLAADFKLPGGDKAIGEEVFVSLNCNQCHTVYGTDLDEPKGKRRLNLPLAGEARFVRSYEELIIAITNPQHVVTERYREILSGPEQAGEIKAFMPDLTNDMSVRQLMDLVAFLNDAYATQLKEYEK